ncbi:MAG: hypothetical protein Q7T55_26760, partial [Solirubrobacteraceae bacterium]|nr:hypothetical protein [Solirubrobacteraceae bacterium]
ACVMTPFVLIYQGWTYWVFRQRIAPNERGAGLGFGVAGTEPALAGASGSMSYGAGAGAATDVGDQGGEARR